MRRRLAGVVALASVFFGVKPLSAKVHRIFEPTDLNLQSEGTLQTHTQLGLFGTRQGAKLLVPDYELDLGLSPTVELDIDGALTLAGPSGNSSAHLVQDNLWLGTKLGLYTTRLPHTDRAWGLALQLGPKLPTADRAHGVGYQALLVWGQAWHGSHCVIILGALLDPGAQLGGPRPLAGQLGVDLDHRLGPFGLSILGEVALQHYLFHDDDDLHVTAGLSISPLPRLALSTVGLWGLLAATRHTGALLGLTTRSAWW